MQPLPISGRQLQALLGQSCELRGRSWRVRDLLPDAGLLVLESADQQVQSNAYGEGHRRVPDRLELSLGSEEAQALLRSVAERISHTRA